MKEVVRPGLIERARKAVSLFTADQALVHGEKDIQDSLTPPAAYGTYSIRLPDPDSLIKTDLGRIRAIEWTCMDRRVAQPFHQFVTASDFFSYDPSEVLIVSYGGGGIQEGRERISATRAMFEFVQALIPNVESVFVGAHTETCGAVKAFLGGTPLREALNPQATETLKQKYPFPEEELAATIELLAGAKELLPPRYQSRAIPLVAAPLEELRNITAYFGTFSRQRLSLEQMTGK